MIDERFMGFIEENEQEYGEEIRARYGDIIVDVLNERLKGLTQAQYDESERLRAAYEEKLMTALAAGDPAGQLAQDACELHKQWLCVFYPSYSKEYHKGLGEMYAQDERFRAYYEKIAHGCADFFQRAIDIFTA